MAISVKSKIRLGTIFLFVLIILLGGFGIYFLQRLQNDAKDVLKDNYNSLTFSQEMQNQLDSIKDHRKSTVDFETALQKQEHNITEPGEEVATKTLRFYFEKLKGGDTSLGTIEKTRKILDQILTLNMAAIQQKNLKAQKTAEDALTVIWLIAAIIIIIGLTFSFNFPNVVVGPIQELTLAIKEIGNKNYSHRIHIKNKDEFGQLANAFNDMAERLEYFESSNLNHLLFEKARAEAVINSLKDASIGIDKNDKILFANYQALNILGLSAVEMVGKSVNEVKGNNELFRFLVENESSAPFKIVMDNKENYFTKEVMEISQQESKSKVIVLKNITSFKELDVAKTNFIATVSHELKTPLASSDFSLKLLEDNRVSVLTKEQKELVNQLKSDNQRMLRILSELLNMSQVETGKIQLDIKEVSPDAIASNAIEGVTNSAKEKEIKLIKNYTAELPNVLADADKTGWILNNFLTNAIKYSPEASEITISVSSNEQVIFSVEDHGPGIPIEYHDKIFDRFFKVPGSLGKGTGLGLAISKEFIESQRGKIWVESTLGKGSTFYFTLPKVTET